jgi:HEAT repeat protein
MADVDKLIKDLKSENEAVRSYAVNDIGQLNDDRTVQPLIDLLIKEKSVIIRESIFRTLAQIEGPKVIDALLLLLRSDEAFIRNQAITVLKEKGDDSLEPLRDLLKDPNKDVRKLALDALFSFRHQASSKIIAEALNDPAINVKITAVEYLGKLESKNHINEVNKVLIESKNILLTCSCLETIAIIGNEESIQIIKDEFSDLNKVDPLIQFSLIKVIGVLGNEDSLNMLNDILDKYGTIYSKEIIQAVKNISKRFKIKLIPDRLFNSFIKIIGELDEMGAYSFLNLLSSFKNEQIYSLLLEKLKSENRMIKLGAIEGLGKYGNMDALSVLENLLEGEEDEELIEVISDTIETLK